MATISEGRPITKGGKIIKWEFTKAVAEMLWSDL